MSFRLFLAAHESSTLFRAVLPGGTFPGPVIRGNKGDRFQINVVDHLTDATMLRSTSIVRCNVPYHTQDLYSSVNSTGMGFFSRKNHLGLMVQRSSHNALLLRAIRSYIIFGRQTKLALFGITLIYVSY